jgi:hypothetical protein
MVASPLTTQHGQMCITLTLALELPTGIYTSCPTVISSQNSEAIDEPRNPRR